MSKFLDDHFKIIHVTPAPTTLPKHISYLKNTFGISQAYAETVSFANLDWQVAQHVRWSRLAHEHSANEAKAEFIRNVAVFQHGLDTVTTAINSY
jgi:hypothetical protein